MFQKFKFKQNIEIGLALISLFVFASWWFQPAHVASNFIGNLRLIDYLLFGLVSFIIWHPVFMEVLVWLIASHIKERDSNLPQPGLKVAFITTIVPANESLDLLYKCLPAMVNADYPHDTWLLDEGGDARVKAICDQFGVKYFSRYGSRRYNLLHGRFARKTKGGNHNSWYDVYGKDYDIVAQLDTDFIPKRNFLSDTLGFFNDPKVAFVGTPQVYGNIDKSFIARGAAEQQYYFYGTVLQGLNGMESTLLIGANHIIRVNALKDVGYYSAHITEDLLTGMKLHANNWKSVYYPSELAVGEGPATWESYFNQQMRWAYGCMDIFFHHSPSLFKQMGVRRALYYFFLQQHYFSGVIVAVSTALLCLYFFAGVTTANIDVQKFLTFYPLVVLLCWFMSVRLQRYNIHSQRKLEMQVLGRIISIAAWPIYFLAFICVLLRKRLTYKVTPKGEDENVSPLHLKLFIPHFIFGGLALSAIISSFVTGRQDILMLLWAASSVLLMFTIPFIQLIVNVAAPIRLKVMGNLLIAGASSDFGILEVTTPSSKGFSLQPLHTALKKARLAREESHTIMDVLFIILVGMISVIPYMQKIGFYSDDWSFLSMFHFVKSQNVIDLFIAANTPNTFMRPVQNFYDAALFAAFGLNPLGYQIVNGIVVIAIAVLFYKVLQLLKAPRILTIMIPLIYLLMPNFVTDRFWYAAFQANLSVLFYFFSLLAGLKSLSVKTVDTFRWKVASIVSMVLSILSYEVVTPFYLINIIIFWFYNNSAKRSSLNAIIQERNKSVFIFVTLIAFAYSLAFKALTTIRLESTGRGPSYYANHALDVIGKAFHVNFVTLGVNLPAVWLDMIHSSESYSLLIASGAVGIAVTAYLLIVAFKKKAHMPGKKLLSFMMVIGLPIFILGYTIFFTNSNVGFSPTGVENRVAIAAGIGLTLIIVGGIGCISHLLLPTKLYKVVFSATIGIMCAGGYLYINTIALYWEAAYQEQTEIVGEINRKLPQVPQGSIVFLDGVCPYVGPAPIFEASWDLKGVLQMQYDDPTIQADVVTPKVQVGANGITTHVYNTYTTYPYKNFIIYNYKTKKSYTINNINEAKEYFRMINPHYKKVCPKGSEGSGVPVIN